VAGRGRENETSGEKAMELVEGMDCRCGKGKMVVDEKGEVVSVGALVCSDILEGYQQSNTELNGW
jgi:hypothetical protein